MERLCAISGTQVVASMVMIVLLANMFATHTPVRMGEFVGCIIMTGAVVPNIASERSQDERWALQRVQ